MANTTTTPNMNLNVPVVSVDPGPDWANNVNACFSVVDLHNHTPGYGVAIPPSGLNINTSLNFNAQSAINLLSTVYATQGSTLSTPYSVYTVGLNLYYTNGSGTAVQITNGSSVNAGAGSITGLTSPAAVIYSGGIFNFQSNTNTPAAINGGDLTVGQEVNNGYGVTIQASGSQSANYPITLPIGLPSSTAFLSIDNSGNMGTSIPTGTGSIVLNSAPTITSATLTTPSISNATLSGSTLTVSASDTTFNNAIVVGGAGTYANQSVAMAIFGGTLPGNSSTTFTVGAGSRIVGLCGTYNVSGASPTAIGSYSTDTQVTFSTDTGLSSQQFIVNNNINGPVTYYVTAFYQ